MYQISPDVSRNTNVVEMSLESLHCNMCCLNPTIKPPQFRKRKCRKLGLSDQGCGAPRQPPGLFVNKSFETFIFLASFIGSNLPQACPIPVLASLLCHSKTRPFASGTRQSTLDLAFAVLNTVTAITAVERCENGSNSSSIKTDSWGGKLNM